MLDQIKLKKALEGVFKSRPDSPKKAAEKWAKAYDDYAKGVQPMSPVTVSGKLVATFTGSEVKKLEAMIYQAISQPKVATPAMVATAWANGVQAYWFAPPIMFTGDACIPPPPPTGFGGLPQVGAVMQAATVVPIITPGLTACLANLNNTETTCAATMASVLHSATLTVMVMIAPPPGTVLPLL